MITVIGMIKNAADIIETYIRANALVADNFVLLNNMCTDRTIDILNSLIREGYQIEIIDDNEPAYNQSVKMTKLAKYAVEKYNSDIVIPIDDDEILVGPSNIELNKVLSMLPDDVVYQATWRVYVPTEDDDNDICVPKRQKVCFSSKHKTLGKAIIPGKICKLPGFMIAQGNHFVIADGEIKIIDLPELRMAHYPCRSEEQLKSKALVGWTNYLVTKRKDIWGLQWKNAYDKIKAGDRLGIDEQWKFCFMYLEDTDENDIELVFAPIEIDESAFVIKYTGDNEINAMKNYMENVEMLAKKYVNLLKDE